MNSVWAANLICKRLNRKYRGARSIFRCVSGYKKSHKVKEALLKARFNSELKKGTGAAMLLMKKNSDIDFSKEIIKAARVNYAYDAQSEGSRAAYVTMLARASANTDKIRRSVLRNLSKTVNDTWDLVQLFEMAEQFAADGDQEPTIGADAHD